jgi:Zn-dependent protease with chaperone function
MARAVDLRTLSEKKLFAVAFSISVLAWLAIVVTIVGLLYGLFIGLFLFVAHALMIAHIKGNAVRVSKEQFPEIHQRVSDAARKLGLETAPAAYVLQAGGALNAFATKFVGRNFMVIYSDLLDACSDDGRELDMIIGHEIGHLALGHLRWIWFLIPARVLPWLGPAYSRACEYSCDLCGYEAAGEFEAAARGLAILAAGGKYGAQVDLDAFVKQAADTSGFWTSVYELNASHPYLPKRVAALKDHKNPGSVPAVSRHLLAYPLAPMFSFGSAAGPGLLVMVAIIGIMAAIAIPQFAKYREKAKHPGGAAPQGMLRQDNAEQDTMDAFLRTIHAAAGRHKARAGAWPCKMEELQVPEVTAFATAKQWEVWVNCTDRNAAIVFPGQDRKRNYRAIYFDSGALAGGQLNE